MVPPQYAAVPEVRVVAFLKKRTNNLRVYKIKKKIPQYGLTNQLRPMGVALKHAEPKLTPLLGFLSLLVTVRLSVLHFLVQNTAWMVYQDVKLSVETLISKCSTSIFRKRPTF